MRSRWLVAAFALIGAVGFALSVQVAWWARAEVAVGPFGTRHCFGGECRETGMSWLGGTDLWLRSAVATRYGAWIAMVLLVVLAGAVTARRVPRLVARTSLVAITTAAVVGGYFVAAFPGFAGAGLDLGAALFGVGVVAGAAAAVLVITTKR